jgi:hypothetical protein
MSKIECVLTSQRLAKYYDWALQVSYIDKWRQEANVGRKSRQGSKNLKPERPTELNIPMDDFWYMRPFNLV